MSIINAVLILSIGWGLENRAREARNEPLVFGRAVNGSRPENLAGRVGSGRVGSGRVGSGRVGSGRVGSGWV